MHLAAAALVLVIAFVFFSQGWIGGGDAKLAAATALWFGFDYLLDYLIYASLFGGVLTLAMHAVPQAAAAGRACASSAGFMRLHETGAGVPYGIALAAAALAVYPKTGWMPAYGL